MTWYKTIIIACYQLLTLCPINDFDESYTLLPLMLDQLIWQMHHATQLRVHCLTHVQWIFHPVPQVYLTMVPGVLKDTGCITLSYISVQAIHSFIYSFIHSFIHLFTVHSSTYSSIHSSIHVASHYNNVIYTIHVNFRTRGNWSSTRNYSLRSPGQLI